MNTDIILENYMNDISFSSLNTQFYTKKVKAVSTSEHLFTFGNSKEMKIKEVLRDIWPKEFRKILEKFKH